MSNNLYARTSRFNVFPEAEYTRYVSEHPQVTPYHHSAWLQAVESAYGHTCWLITVHQGEHLCGVLPLVEVKPPIGARSLVSLPFCDLGGVLADSDEVRDNLISEAKTLAKTNRAQTLEIREGGLALDIEKGVRAEDLTPHLGKGVRPSALTPYSSHSGKGVRSSALTPHSKVRMLCELPETSEALFKSYKPKLRSQIRKAEKNGLRSELRTDAEAINLFYDVFAQNMHRLGSPVHSLRWFQDLKAAYGDQMLISLVFKEDKPVGAGIVLVQGKQACIPWASTLEEFNRLAPNMLLYWTFLSHVCDVGCTTFDFGRSTLDEGTYRFKKQWGAKPYELIWTDYSNGGHSDIAHESAGSSKLSQLRPLIENIWCHLPLAFTNWLGPKLRRYITL